MQGLVGFGIALDTINKWHNISLNIYRWTFAQHARFMRWSKTALYTPWRVSKYRDAGLSWRINSERVKAYFSRCRMSLVTISIRLRVARRRMGVKKGGFASDGNPMFTGGEIKLKLVSIPFSAFVTIPLPLASCTSMFYLFKSPVDSKSFFSLPPPQRYRHRALLFGQPTGNRVQ